MKRENRYTYEQALMHDWGAWARRPQFWAKLRVSGMWALLPIPRESRPPRDFRLSPRNAAIHREVMRMPDNVAGVLYAYYVRQVNWDADPDVFKRFGIPRRTFYELLKRGTSAACNASDIDVAQNRVLDCEYR
jgi:hypothetical protein